MARSWQPRWPEGGTAGNLARSRWITGGYRRTTLETQRKIALVVVDHGSRNPAANASLEETVRQVQASSGGAYVAVLAAHMELAPPGLGTAVDEAVAAGAQEVVVALYFLSPGRHSETDVPRLVAEAASRHPAIRFHVTAALGPHRSLAALVLERASDALR